MVIAFYACTVERLSSDGLGGFVPCCALPLAIPPRCHCGFPLRARSQAMQLSVGLRVLFFFPIAVSN